VRKAKAETIPPQLEKDWSNDFKQLFESLGYEGYHTWTSIHSPRGWADWSLANTRQERLIYVELKRDIKSSVCSPDQLHWRDLILACGGEWYCFRPHDFDDAAKVLQHKPEVNLWLE
jgi:hypothetical protein